MKTTLTIILTLIILTSFGQKSAVKISKENNIDAQDLFLNSIDRCENSKFFSVLEEIPNQNVNAYKLTITSKKGEYKSTKILDTRPGMSQINYCNDLYTVVGFPCGGPCYAKVFVFTDKNKPSESYAYAQKVSNNQNLITHIKNEEFEKLIIHNFLNGKELIVNISDANLLNYGQMDSMVFQKDNLILYYKSANRKYKSKTINLKSIF